MKRTDLVITLILALLFSLVARIPVVKEVRANTFPALWVTPIYIRNDGSVDPTNASINRVGNTYILTENDPATHNHST